MPIVAAALNAYNYINIRIWGGATYVGVVDNQISFYASRLLNAAAAHSVSILALRHIRFPSNAISAGRITPKNRK